MTYKISDDRKRLTIRVDEAERQELRNWETERAAFTNRSIQSDLAMHDFLETLICNSELEWISIEHRAYDLTDAPMLGIYGEERPFEHKDAAVLHRITGPNLIQEVLERWAFMDYQVRSVLEDLRDKGEAVFIS